MPLVPVYTIHRSLRFGIASRFRTVSFQASVLPLIDRIRYHFFFSRMALPTPGYLYYLIFGKLPAALSWDFLTDSTIYILPSILGSFRNFWEFSRCCLFFRVEDTSWFFCFMEFSWIWKMLSKRTFWDYFFVETEACSIVLELLRVSSLSSKVLSVTCFLFRIALFMLLKSYGRYLTVKLLLFKSCESFRLAPPASAVFPP